MLQPFKHITVIMKDRTNEGMQEVATGKPNMKPLIMLKNDLRYYPITLNDDGYGVIFGDGNKTSHYTIGVLMESFNKTFAQHKVLVHGIVPMKAATGVKPGMPVHWDVTNNRVTTTVTTETPYVGRAMTGSKADGDMIDVLIG